MDRAILISWYDLPAVGREAHLEWLHRIFMPKVMKRPGVLWAAHYAAERITHPPRIRHTAEPVPAGNEYILLVGAESSHAFTREAKAYADGTPSRFEASLTDEDRGMLAARAGERVCLMTEEARVDGPEVKLRAGQLTPAPCIQLGSFRGNTTGAEEQLLAWYADWRMPALGKLPGCVGMRKMVAVHGWARHGVMYEFASLQARNQGMQEVARLYPEMEAWTNRFIPELTHAPGSPNIACRIWPPVK